MRNYSMGPGISTTEVIWEGEHETTIPGTIRRGTFSLETTMTVFLSFIFKSHAFTSFHL